MKNTIWTMAIMLAMAATASGAQPVELKEVAMLLRNGIPAAEVVADVQRRKLLETPSNAEIVALGAPQTVEAALRDPGNALGTSERERHAEREEARHWRKLVSEGRVAVGMSAADVLKSWGKPKSVNRSTSERGSREQWVYDGDYLYIEDGRLDYIQTRSRSTVALKATPTPKPGRKPYTQRATLPGNQWIHLVRYGGPNEFMMLTDVEMTHIDVRWKRSSRATKIKIKSRDRTLIHDDGHGCKTYYVDSIDRKAGSGVFEFEHAADSVYHPLK